MVAGADHLVAGSDYPVLMAFETCGVPAEDVDKILDHNAQIILGLAH